VIAPLRSAPRKPSQASSTLERAIVRVMFGVAPSSELTASSNSRGLPSEAVGSSGSMRGTAVSFP
jgi:hypothetical protein